MMTGGYWVGAVETRKAFARAFLTVSVRCRPGLVPCQLPLNSAQ